MYAAIVFFPLLGFIIAGVFGRLIGRHLSEIIPTALLFASAALSVYAFYDVAIAGNSYIIPIAPWITSGDFQVDWTLRIDALTAVMLVVVTGVSSLVHLYSIGYMEEDPHTPRFFSYLSLFTFAMLMLVTANNLLQLFFGWEGVGLASYLLIGFWYDRPSANAAAIKAFVVNRVGDFGFALGVFGLYAVFGTLDFERIFMQAPMVAGQTFMLRRLRSRHPDDALHPPLHRRVRKIRADRPAHLAPRRDGRPDAGLRADPCRDHGDRRRVPGLPRLAAVRAGAGRARRRRHRRRHDRVLRRVRRPLPARHQARHRLFDLLAARLHVRRRRRLRLQRRDVPPVHARLVQGAAVPGRGLGDPRAASRAGHAQHGRAEGEAPLHLGDDADRHDRAHGARHPVHVAWASPASSRRTRSSNPPSWRTPAPARMRSSWASRPPR